MIDVFLVLNLSTRQLCAVNISTDVLEACYPVAIGKPSTPTLTGNFQVTNVVKNPQYVSCQTGVNQGFGFLGSHAIVTNLATTIPNCPMAIHGTNKENLIGLEVSGGCGRMKNSDIQHLIQNFNFVEGIVL